MSRRIAVIDVGSNSIKALVAESDGSEFGIRSLWEGTREVRISTGIADKHPMLLPQRIEQAVGAIHDLYERCLEVDPACKVHIVATSAVRSAGNSQEFMDAVRARTGVVPKVISGQEEADCIAMGIRSDPAIGGRYPRFTVFDLGGGSMELIRFIDNHVSERTSLLLGSVRLTEMFVENPHLPLPEHEITSILEHVRNSINTAEFRFQAPLIGCSGGLTMWRAIRASEEGLQLTESNPVFTLEDVDSLINEVVHKDVVHRIESAHIPAPRADIFPVALLTFKVLFELSHTQEIFHSLHNLRYGVAWTFLQD